MKVSNIISDKGNAIPNQFYIEHENVEYFQSYRSLCAKWDGKTLTLGRDWDYSVTTMKYLWKWLRSTCWTVVDRLPDGKSGADRIRKAIASGLIVYDERMR